MESTDPGERDATELSEPPADIPSLRDAEKVRLATGRNRLLANGLLATMGALFAGSWLIPNPGFGTALLRAGSEAGIVGGLADWFAVTALFRHPLGLPIPHTAILPHSKDRIGRALGAFVEQGFLTEAVILPRLRAARPGRRLAAWLSSPANVAFVVEPVAAALPQIAHAVEKGDLRDFLNQSLGDQLRTIDLAPIVGRTLEVLTQSGEGDILFERVIGFMLQWLESNRTEIDRLVAQRSRWWVPASVDRGIARTIVQGVTDLLNGLHEPDSGTRERFRDALAKLIDTLRHAPEQRQEWNAARDRLLQHPEVQAWFNAIWTRLSEALAADLADPESRTRAVLEKAVLSIGQVLAADPAMQDRIDRTLERATARIIAHRGQIARIMADVIRGWDAQTLTNRLELVLGNDLQYIRMNGTVVGCLVGCGLFLIGRAIG